ncbi:MAG: dihydrofolate reductase [Mucilaginibacter polytrichastri]|nr:dihydrofolate reductase [Mucilaginibacter polytrichastri]
MRHIHILIHLSLDGFLADARGSLDHFPAGDENLDYVYRLTEKADTALFGRRSWELLEAWWPGAAKLPGASAAQIGYSRWYNEAQKIVATNSRLGEHQPGTQFISGDLGAALNAVKQQPGADILLFGSASVARQLMAAGVVDHYRIFINPVLFGSGIPLFSDELPLAKLKLCESHSFPNGEIALHYVPA